MMLNLQRIAPLNWMSTCRKIILVCKVTLTIITLNLFALHSQKNANEHLWQKKLNKLRYYNKSLCNYKADAQKAPVCFKFCIAFNT